MSDVASSKAQRIPERLYAAAGEVVVGTYPRYMS